MPDTEVARATLLVPPRTFRGREFKGLRGFSGKPLHPPLTDVRIGAYVIVAAVDVISFISDHTAWQQEFYQAATFTYITGAVYVFERGGNGGARNANRLSPTRPSLETRSSSSPR